MISALKNLARSLNWHVLFYGLGGLFVAGGPVAFVLTSFDVSPAMQATIFQRAGGIIGLMVAVGVIVRMALNQTDKGKASTLSNLDDDAQRRVIANMAIPDQVQLAKNVTRIINTSPGPAMPPPPPR